MDDSAGDADRGVKLMHHTVNVGFGTDIISKAARLANGSSEPPRGNCEEKDGPLAIEDSSSGGKRSHGSEQGSRDRLVEMAIQCLDEKVDRGALTDEALELLRLVPEGYIPLPHQVGGHRHVDGKLGFLRRMGQEDILYKPVQPGIKGSTEVQFYQSLFGDAELPREVVSLRQLVPGYYCKETIRDRAGNLHEFLKLEDITHRYKKPCIMDVKVGRRVWDDFAEKDKIDRERKKYPAQETLGFRIIGMRVYQPSTGDYVYYDKWYGRSITENTALQAVRNFFVCGEVNRVDVIPAILGKLQLFLGWFRTQTSLRLFATSLLLVYEGAPANHPDKPAPPVDIRLVDFAHTYESVSSEGETDNNTLYGLENFEQCLSFILKNQI
jgi:1D-myo-inositol-tetrakisphosphate 5-kinase/inositol-polyphosphate multikinase